ncbi:MAG: hypothetical protein AAGA48_22940 [Myxococcota bacterium]
MRLFGLLLLLPACSGDPNPDDDRGTDTGEPALFFTFKSQLRAADIVADISEPAVEAHQASNMVLATTRLLAGDVNVQNELRAFGQGEEEIEERGAFQCWEGPFRPRFSFTLSFGSACSQFDLEGAARIERHPTQQLLYTYQNFKINDREIGGTLGINTVGAFDEPFFFVMYDTDADNPGRDPKENQRVPLGVKLSSFSQPVGVTFDGGSAVNFVNQTWSVWGTSQLSGKEPITVVHGAASPEGVAPDAPTGANVLRSSLDWLECRCPTQGLASQDMPLIVTDVVIDIDELEESPDSIDDPELTVPAELRIDGRGILNYTGCGEYELSYEAEPLTVTLDKQLMFAELQFLCDTRTINDPARCTALQQALLRNSEDFVVEITGEDLLNTANDAAARQLDTTWCRY